MASSRIASKCKILIRWAINRRNAQGGIEAQPVEILPARRSLGAGGAIHGHDLGGGRRELPPSCRQGGCAQIRRPFRPFRAASRCAGIRAAASWMNHAPSSYPGRSWTGRRSVSLRLPVGSRCAPRRCAHESRSSGVRQLGVPQGSDERRPSAAIGSLAIASVSSATIARAIQSFGQPIE